jgi:hypothetical protein
MSVEKALELASALSPSVPATDSIQSTVIQVTQINVNVSSLPSLPERQALLLDELYETSKQTTKSLLSAESMSDAMKIGQLMAMIVKLVEKASYKGEKIPGAEKKEIALALGKRLVSDPAVIPGDGLRAGVGMAYDLLAESLLETLLDVSRHVNTAIKEAAISCCESLLASLKK